MPLKNFFGIKKQRRRVEKFSGKKSLEGPKQRERAKKGWEERSGGIFFSSFFHLLLSFLPSLLLWGLLVYTSYKCYMEIQMEEVKK